MSILEIDNAINSMPRDVFFENIFCGIVLSSDFSSDFSDLLVDANCVSDTNKQKIRSAMVMGGIPDSMLQNDQNLLDAAKCIMGRAVQIR